MSRSRKKYPIHGNTSACSEKDDKARARRSFRHAEKIRVNTFPEEDPPHEFEHGNRWLWHKDGLQWLDPTDPENYRK